jgi:hypothetical protein
MEIYYEYTHALIMMRLLGILYIPFIQQFETSIILEYAEALLPLTVLIVVGIGLMQGWIVGSAIVERFPRLTYHARMASILLLALFSLNAIGNVLRFMYPNKIHMPLLFSSDQSSLGRMIDLSNPLTLLTLSLTMLMFALLSMIRVRDYKRYFLLVMSIVMAFITSALIFSDYKPTQFEVMLYSLYQAGIVGGAFIGTRMELGNKELRFRYLRDKWTGYDV